MKCRDVIKTAQKQKRKLLTLAESQLILEEHGIPFVKSLLVKYPEEAVAAANRLGYPVALKIVSQDISHKTDMGGVVIGLQNEQDVQQAFKKILSSVKQKIPHAKISGFSVQQMAGGLELLIGGKKDSQFGQTVAFGAGGVFVEVYDDISFRVVPITKKDAEEMVREVKAYKILRGYRGKTYDVWSVEKVLLETSKLLEEHQEISELDINPLFVREKGALAVDARISLI